MTYNLASFLQRQFRALKNKDPKEKQQKAIPACLIAKIAKQKLTELQCAISQLIILAFFLCHAFLQVRQSPTTTQTTN